VAGQLGLLAGLGLILGTLSPAFAVIEVVARVSDRTQVQCLALLTGGPLGTHEVSTFLKEKKGIRQSYGGKDPTDQAPVKLSEQQAIEVVFGDLERIHSEFELVFRKMGMNDEEIRTQIAAFKKQDQFNHNLQLSAGRAFYFTSRNRNGDLSGFIRVVAVRGESQGRLPLEEKISLSAVTDLNSATGNRAELGRAFMSGGPYSEIFLREILQEISKTLLDHFQKEDFTVYGLSNKARARTYRGWGFTDRELTGNVGSTESHLCSQSGKEFYDRYQGHLERAKNAAFRGYPFPDPEAGLRILTDFAARPGMKDYLPNLILQSAIYASKQDYAKALAISEILKKIANPNSEANLDFNTLWRSRIKYSPFGEPKGDSRQALKLINDYLLTNPLDTETYNFRSALFLIYKFKIFLSIEDFGSAKELLRDHKTFLKKTLDIHRGNYEFNWRFIRAYLVAFLGDVFVSQQLLLAMDLGTNLEGVAISALAPEAYFSIARQTKALGMIPESDYFEKVGWWLNKALGEFELPVLGRRP
jgi:hypothetical protein